MHRYLLLIFLVVFVTFLALPCRASAASITEDHVAIGQGCVANGTNSTAMGLGTDAEGNCSTAMGMGSTAIGDYSTAMGLYTTAIGTYSISMGYHTTAYASSSSVIGTGRGAWAQLVNNTPSSFMVGYMADDSDTTPEFFVQDGAVGIGTQRPNELLEIGGIGRAFFGDGGGISRTGLLIDGNEPGPYARLEAYNYGTGTGMALVMNTIGGGSVGIGTTDPTHRLTVNGTASKPGGGTWSVYSDARLKDITGEYQRGLEDIVRLRPVTFFYKPDNPKGLPTNDEYIGFIAQEVQEVFPEAVSEGPDGYLDFNMHPVNVALVNAVKELKAENETLKAENMAMREDIARIKAVLGI